MRMRSFARSRRRQQAEDHAHQRGLPGAVRPQHADHLPRLDGENLPLDDDSCDCGLLTLTLCTIPDAEQALRELRRVIRPGGRLHFLEHGHSPDERVATWQRRFEPLQKRVFDGCHLTRNIPEMIADAGFIVEWVDSSYAKGPKPHSYFSVGVATNA